MNGPLGHVTIRSPKESGSTIVANDCVAGFMRESHALVLMARNRKPTRRFNLRKVRIAAAVTMGAVAALDVVAGTIHPTPVNPLRAVSLKASYMWSGIAAPADDGMEFGIAHSDYSAAEIEECLEASAAIDQGDKIAQERANRLVRTIGMMSGSGPATDGQRAYNNGRPVKVKLNWLLGIGDSLIGWARNGSGVVWTTGSELLVQGDLWVKD